TIEPTMPSRPGARAAHIWIERNQDSISTLDLFDTGMTLLAGPSGHPWADAAQAAARQLGVPMNTHVGSSSKLLPDPATPWRTRYGLETDRAVLVRPDGHVVWRTPRAVENRVVAMTAALMQVLGRTEGRRQQAPAPELVRARSA